MAYTMVAFRVGKFKPPVLCGVTLQRQIVRLRGYDGSLCNQVSDIAQLCLLSIIRVGMGEDKRRGRPVVGGVVWCSFGISLIDGDCCELLVCLCWAAV